MKKIVSLIVLLVGILCLTACGDLEGTNPTTSASNSTTVANETTIPSTNPPTPTGEAAMPTTSEIAIKTYPLNVEKTYADYATGLPAIIYTTSGSENGLIGTIYTFEGTVLKKDVIVDDETSSVFESVVVSTSGGQVYITNMYKAVYMASVSALGEQATKSVYSDEVSDYVFPAKDESGRFFVIYCGYSEVECMPVFYLGASHDLYSILDVDDPVARNSTGKKPESSHNTPSGNSSNVDSDQSKDDNPTTGEKNALREAKNYLRIMNFSYSGLIDQLKYEGYTTGEATYAADHCGAEWKDHALNHAKSYLDVSAFSYEGLLDQLKYEGYTTAEATFAVDNCGADWYKQAEIKAASYLSFMSFSKKELVSQLEYEGFTHDQAVHGAEANGF